MKTPLTEGVYYILLALYKPRHGYAIMQYVADLSRNRVELGAGTLYGALKSLVQKEWIEQLNGKGRRKEYIITEAGKEMVRLEMARLEELYENGRMIMKGANENEIS